MSTSWTLIADWNVYYVINKSTEKWVNVRYVNKNKMPNLLKHK